MANVQGPQFLKYFIPVIDALKELGGSGTPSEVSDFVIDKLKITEIEQEETLKSGVSRVRNQIAWARSYCVKSGFLDSSQRGVWNLTDMGWKVKLSDNDVKKHFKIIQDSYVKSDKSDLESKDKKPEDIDSHIVPEYIDTKGKLLNILQNMSPNSFEKICQRLLRESGFEQVSVTGKSGDGGIDGIGILKINPLVSFRVLFQSKRYRGSVSSSQLRDFRGAIQGRADKGIIITTGSFTLEAKKEARRDGVEPIELVDGEKLVEMFERLELGLKPKKAYEIDYEFFREYD
ncbi:restriction endonuclease [candidate division KSB1 bacterium]